MKKNNKVVVPNWSVDVSFRSLFLSIFLSPLFLFPFLSPTLLSLHISVIDLLYSFFRSFSISCTIPLTLLCFLLFFPSITCVFLWCWTNKTVRENIRNILNDVIEIRGLLVFFKYYCCFIIRNSGMYKFVRWLFFSSIIICNYSRLSACILQYCFVISPGVYWKKRTQHFFVS